MAPSTVNTPFEYAQQLLAVCEDALATTIGGIPARSYIAHATPAFDCTEQLTVHIGGLSSDPTTPLSPAPVTGRRFKDGTRHMLQLVATIIRCTPQPSGLNSGPPSEAALELLARTCSQDLWSIWCLVLRRMRDNELFAGSCGVLNYQGGSPSVESGAAAGWFFTVTTGIPGYDPEGS